MNAAPAATHRVWLVWSNEHTAWWRANSAGYTTDIREAGRYTHAEALSHSRSGRLHPDGKPEEVPVLAPEGVDAEVAAIPDDCFGALEAEIVRLRDRYEKPGQRCNGGHVNNLPVALWDCPMHTEEMRSLLLDFERQWEALIAFNCECADRASRERGDDPEHGDNPNCPEHESCDCLTCRSREFWQAYKRKVERQRECV